MKKIGWFAVWFVVGFLVASAVTQRVIDAQERDASYPETRMWQVWQLPPLWRVDGPRIDVVDTAGVCIYVARWGNGMEVAAVPKTQLPKGAGCQ